METRCPATGASSLNDLKGGILKRVSEVQCDCERVREIVDTYDCSRDNLISILQDIQCEYQYLPEDALRVVAQLLDLSYIQVYGVATFFKAFSLEPKGKHIVSVCLGTACHVRNAPHVLDELRRELCIEPGETSEDMQFSLETVNCLGACALGPIMVIDGTYHGEMNTGKVKKVLRTMRRNAE